MDAPRDRVPPDAVGLRFQLSVADRNRLRIAAARAGKSMAAHTREIVVKYLDTLEAKARGRIDKGD